MKKFLVMYKMPLSGLDAWQAKPKEETKPEEDRLMQKWQAWMSEHGQNVLEGYGAGKTKVVKTDGVSDFRNEMMIVNIVQGEDREAVAKMFQTHPHLEIPESWIEIMELNVLGMGA